MRGYDLETSPDFPTTPPERAEDKSGAPPRSGARRAARASGVALRISDSPARPGPRLIDSFDLVVVRPGGHAFGVRVGDAAARASSGRGRHAFFHSASLRKKKHRAVRSADARPAPVRAIPGASRHGSLRRRRPIMPSLSDFALAAAVLGLRRDRRAAPAGRPSSARRLYRTGVFCKLTPTPSPTPPRSRAADRPQLGFPLPSSRFCKLFPGPSLPARPHRCACGSTPGAPSISLFYCLFQ